MTLGRDEAASVDRGLDRVEHVLLDRGQDQRALLAVLGLGAEVEGDPLRVGVVAGDHHQLRGAGVGVDPDQALDLALRLLDPGVSGPGDDVDRRHALGPVGEREDRLGAAHREDLIDAGEGGGREDDRVHLAVGARRRGEGDPLDPRDPGRDRAHQDARRVERPAAGGVDAGGGDRDAADGHGLPLGKAHRPGLRIELGLGDGADVGRGELERLAQLGVDGGERRLGGSRIDRQAGRAGHRRRRSGCSG